MFSFKGSDLVIISTEQSILKEITLNIHWKY